MAEPLRPIEVEVLHNVHWNNKLSGRLVWGAQWYSMVLGTPKFFDDLLVLAARVRAFMGRYAFLKFVFDPKGMVMPLCNAKLIRVEEAIVTTGAFVPLDKRIIEELRDLHFAHVKFIGK